VVPGTKQCIATPADRFRLLFELPSARIGEQAMGPKSLTRALRSCMWLFLVAVPVAFVPARYGHAAIGFHNPAAVVADEPCWTCGH
jgi:hypothetical protein